jgi:glycosyltransferase involved in cell wall biosynthesis
VPALVSIIIPTYNRADLVGEAIESALCQTYPAREVIVVDDGSTDGTPEVLARYGDAIRWVRTTNRGCAAARNTGVGLALGDYLAFVDSDDVAPPDKLATQVPVLEAHPEIGFVYGPSEAFGPELPTDQVHQPVRPDPSGSVAEGLFLSTRIGFDSVLLRREAVERAGGFDETLRHNEDTDLLLRIALAWKAICLDVPTGRHRWHHGRKSRDEVALWRAVLLSMQCVLASRPDFRLRLGARAEARLAEVHWEIARALAERGEVAAARAEVADAWRHRPSAALVIWRVILAGPPLVPPALGLARFLARSVGFLQARLRGA